MLLFTIVWDTPGKEKIAKWSSAPAIILEGFNEIEGQQQTFQNRVKNTILPNRPVFTPPQGSTMLCNLTRPDLNLGEVLRIDRIIEGNGKMSASTQGERWVLVEKITSTGPFMDL